jgi:hypothetical protein
MATYTFADICAKIVSGTISIDNSVTARLTRETYYTPYENNTANPYPICYFNPINLFTNMANSSSNGLNFIYTDFTTADDWIILNEAT